MSGYELVGALTGVLVLGAFLGYLIGQARTRTQAAGDLETLRVERATEVSRLEARLEEMQRSHEERLKDFDRTKAELGDLFKGLSDEALSKNNRHFLELAKTTLEKHHETARGDLDKRQSSIDELLKPMKDKLEEVHRNNLSIDKVLAATRAGITEQIGQLAEAHRHLRTETGNLVNALRKPQVRGRWGEMTLKRVAELAGLKEHVSFTLQSHRATDDGALRPDMIVDLPGGRRIIIDAKTSLEAYMDAHSTEEDALREAALTRHAKQIRTHMEQLSNKAYWSQFDDTPEFVVMFVPGENFFSAALDRDPSLLEDGIRNNVVLATPTTLVSLLKAVGFGWRQEALADNAKKVSALGRELYERLATTSEHLEKLGRSLGSSLGHYNKAIGSLETRVFASARKFRDLGIDAKKDLESLEPLDVTPRTLNTPEFELIEPPEENTGT